VPGEPGRPCDQPGQITDGDLLATAEVHWIAAVVSLGARHHALRRILGIEELARRAAVAPQHDLILAGIARLDALADHGWDDVRRLQIEVVARAVQVHREEHDAVHAVLRPVGLRLHQQQLLGDAIGRICLFRVSVPQIIFPERHRRKLRVRADGARDDRLGHAGEAAFLQQAEAHHRVFEEEQAGIVAVGADAAHLGRQVEHHLGPRVLQQLAARRPVDQIVVAPPRNEHLVDPAGPQRLDDEAAEETGASGDQHPAPGQGRSPTGRGGRG
jgi:hypothetical protein